MRERGAESGRGGSLLIQMGRQEAWGLGGGVGVEGVTSVPRLSLISSKRVLKNVDGTLRVNRYINQQVQFNIFTFGYILLHLEICFLV